MSVTLWLDTESEKTVELGPTLPCYHAFAEMAHTAGPSWATAWPHLSGVLTQCELQEDAPPDWLAGMKKEAAAFLKRFGDKLGEGARTILGQLAAVSA